MSHYQLQPSFKLSQEIHFSTRSTLLFVRFCRFVSHFEIGLARHPNTFKTDSSFWQHRVHHIQDHHGAPQPGWRPVLLYLKAIDHLSHFTLAILSHLFRHIHDSDTFNRIARSCNADCRGGVLLYPLLQTSLYEQQLCEGQVCTVMNSAMVNHVGKTVSFAE